MKETEFSISNNWLDLIFESFYDGVVIVNCHGEISYITNSYCDFLKIERNKVIGMHVTDVIENTRMHLVVETGKQEFADIQFLLGDYVIANRIPIIENKKIVGAIGTIIFRDIGEWKKMNSHIKGLLSDMNFYRNEWKGTNGLKYSLNDLVGKSNKIKDLKERVKRISGGDISVLIKGESGTGKELIAHSIHQLSDRIDKPFVKVNCGSIPEHLLESELFGYEEGAFTGARKGGKIGKFQYADGGTIFLDEVGDMPIHMQVKLLRVLQEKEFEPIGALQSKKINVRVIAATNGPLEKMIDSKLFRKDLYYRINAFQLSIPPLRDRREDIKLLAIHFLKKITTRIGKRVTSIHPDVLSLMENYDWPGNVRELENVVEAGIHFTNDEMIGKDSIPENLLYQQREEEGKSLKELVEETEKKAIEDVLKRVEFDKIKAAQILGIGKSSLYDKIKRYKISE
ncbi:transcriptional regulator with PAS, ATPase and Fis domain [Bacillus pakistanensis]|uniref:Transcriptional regulator with PAS, ATPase and Fis domain n=1 Tax=Rossellomorea pakistanensis TaxID=992288 RepID=A0ABS2N810_9BACI|nr:sigma 54-interacting transcriptional regulator [Bacillus pakistanensis]MBM7583996.1 transcriptional regulator with PAS, ATPase and Fis domain [Bacillus pakistanensis]